MTSTGNSTVVGLFQDERTARDVVDDLTRSGFSRDAIHFNASDYAGQAASGGSALTGRAPEVHGGGFMGWLKSIFGGDESYHEDMPRYAQAVEGGRHVVAVNTNDNRREEVVEIMNTHDAIDIDRHAAEQEFTTPGTSLGESSMPRGGARIYPRVVQKFSADVTGYDRDFRNHFQTRYGTSGDTYETYEPAYRYGCRIADDPRYQGQDWNTIEPSLRTDYSNRNPGGAWERVKDAVQYGWEKVSGRR